MCCYKNKYIREVVLSDDQTETIEEVVVAFSCGMTDDNHCAFQILWRDFDIRFDGPSKPPCCPNSVFDSRFSPEVPPLRLDCILS